MTYKEFCDKTQREFLVRKLIEYRFNKMKLSKDLGLQRSHLYNLIDKYKIKETDQPTNYYLDIQINIDKPENLIFNYINEIWKPVPSNKNYFVSDFGRVKDHNDIFKTTSYMNGYEHISIIYDGKQTNKGIHQLVALAFIPNPLNKPQVNHINCIRHDNRACNLEWVTPGENIIHAKQFKTSQA